MSSSNCVSCQEQLSCGDSPLSVTGNVIGILTFAYAILGTVIYYIGAISNSQRYLNRLRDDLNDLRLNAVKIDTRVGKMITDTASLEPSDREALQQRRSRLQNAMSQKVFNSLRKQLTWANIRRDENEETTGWYRRWRQRVNYVASEENVRKQLQELKECISALEHEETEILER
jgi:hypothetical protein